MSTNPSVASMPPVEDPLARERPKSKCKCKPPPPNTKGRNLVVCIDGTANQFGPKNSYVVELYGRLKKNEEQLTYYDSGIGTFVQDANFFTRVKQKLEHGIDMAIALHLKDITLGAYQWLSENYKFGDRIYLFGFSRGAYQVRIIAGMIERVGLVHKGNNAQIPFAYQLYAADANRQEKQRESKEGSIPYTKTFKLEDLAKDTSELCKQFKRTLCHDDVSVHFVGVWDTVSSVGVVRGRVLPETTTGMHFVCAFRHALALDELRIKFLPEYAHGGHGPDCHCPNRSDGDIKEVWFAGSHSDVGGGNALNVTLNRCGPALRWMLYEAIDLGLHVEPLKNGAWELASHRPSMTRFWKIFECVPITRLSYSNGRKHDDTVTFPPHLCKGRSIKSGQLIHASVVEFMQRPPVTIDFRLALSKITRATQQTNFKDKLLFWSRKRPHVTLVSPVLDAPTTSTPNFATTAAIPNDVPASIPNASRSYVPNARLPSALEFDWSDILNQESKWYEDARKLIVEDLYASAAQSVAQIKMMLGRSERRPNKGLEPDEMREFLKSTSSDAKRQSFLDFPGSANILLRFLKALNTSAANSLSEDPHLKLKIAKQAVSILARFPTRPNDVEPYPLLTLRRRLLSLIPSKGHNNNVSETVRIFGSVTSDILPGHSDSTRSVTCSPDGRYIVSRDAYNTVRLWNVGMEQPDGQLGDGLANFVRTVQRPNFDIQNAGRSPQGEHPIAVYSTALSPDGTRMVSGEKDNTLRIREVETTKEVGDALKGHTDMVSSVAFSLDGLRVVSGSRDGTVRVWNVETCKGVEVLEGHASAVQSVVFSHDGSRVISGGDDGMIRIWNVESGKEILAFFSGNKGSVHAVCDSPDGNYIASGLDDETVRLWDAETGEAVGQPLRGHTSFVESVTFSPDGLCLVSSARGEKLRLWRLDTPESDEPST